MALTLGQAAKLVGKGKTTLTRAIQAGRLSATRRDDGSYRIDPAELARVYDVRPVTHETVTRDPESIARAAAFEAENRMLKEMLADVREDRDRWRNMAESAQRLLTDQRPNKPRPTSTSEPRRPLEPQEPMSAESVETGMSAIRRHLESLARKAGH
jgi:excisionase family DNA binding protein